MKKITYPECLSRQRNDLFLRNIITGDEKCFFYDYVQCKKQLIDEYQSPQPTLKVQLHGKKVMLCIWWDHHGIIHFEFLNCNQTFNAD